jgi:CRISPR-associated protein Csb1
MTNFSDWATNHDHVAVVLKQTLVSVEGKDAIIFPPTYADAKENYNIDTLSDGRRVVTIDSEGAQANRMEPLFKTDEFKALVPQISIDAKGQIVSLLDAGHRLGDALIRSTPLGEEATEAFEHFLKTGDATTLGRLAPTSLVFGVWDSRGTGAKLPRIVRSVVRGWDVDRLTRSAQYNPAIDYLNLEGLFDEADKKKLEGDTKSATAQLGYVHVPAPGGHGGVLVRGEIVRDVTVNLIAVRRLNGSDEPTTEALRRYILALALIAAREEHDGFYRQGCLLVPEGKPEWWLVSRNGERTSVTLDKAALIKEASTAKAALKVSGDRSLTFSVESARAEVKGKNEEKAAAAAKKKEKAKK